ncbi:Smc5-6 complex non-SMC subunit 1 [Schizosaccharomyces japonicus yFS275]|uniref:Non-structural maintenance of chromosomes element 1 homolog n=1 Tax=Schizosaccharomyces japonicus (strain yFS275 / FY16936) TaxID=402676 RepID=B6K5Z4_SCHJY|nr:Smc5-6 complex non-SMC subunit 1 [Schizosaccharomyces japonicus yFS275]EEB08948.1 Smc5-6 complex non-SMC subunit 1 [Schizosaccharomyces japonicus yFS275]
MLPTRHKVTLQHIISRSAGIEEAELEQFIHRQNEDDRFNDVIDDINRALHDLDFQLKRVLDQIDGRVFWYLQNMSSDTVSQQATFYPSIEVEFFRYLIEWIIQAENYAFSLSSLDIHRLAAKEEKLPLATHTVESYLQDFERDEWLVQRDGMYSLSNRSLADLEQYLRTEYENSVFECNACRGIVTLGGLCNCGYCLHVYCCNRLQSVQCPSCNEPWDNVTKLG